MIICDQALCNLYAVDKFIFLKYNMKRVFIYFFILISSFSVKSQSFDAQIADAMERNDWFMLDSIYRVAPEGSITDFLEVYSRCLIGNRLNRPEVSIPAFEALLDAYYERLSLKQVVSSAVMCAFDHSRVGDNSKAASFLAQVHDRLVSDGKEKDAKVLEKYIKQYAALSDYNPYQITFESDTVRIPFKIVPAGKPEDQGVLMHLDKCFFNGIPADIVFDTGAGANIISRSLVEEYNLIPLDIKASVSGAKAQNAMFAVAKELKIGNMTIADVPFYVMDITANDAEADQYMQSLKIIVGSDLMLQLKDVTLDFENNQILVPTAAPVKTEALPNLCFSAGMNLLAKGMIHDNILLMNVDTGDVSYGTLGKEFYNRNKKFIKSKGPSIDISRAGIGGVIESKGYKVPNMALNLGGNSVFIPEMRIMVKQDCIGGYECNLGLKSLMLFKTVRFNLVDFVLDTEAYDK